MLSCWGSMRALVSLLAQAGAGGIGKQEVVVDVKSFLCAKCEELHKPTKTASEPCCKLPTICLMYEGYIHTGFSRFYPKNARTRPKQQYPEDIRVDNIVFFNLELTLNLRPKQPCYAMVSLLFF